MQALEGELLTAGSAVSLLEVTRAVGDGAESCGRLFDACRRFIFQHGKAVKDAGGLDDLQELSVARGLLGDAVEEIHRLRGGEAGAGGGSRKRQRSPAPL